MTDQFEFIVPVPVVKVGDTRTAEAAFDVTSHLGRHGRVGVEVVPEEGANPAWFQPVQPQEFDLPDGQTAKVTVPIAAPGAPAGTSRFHVRAYAIDRPQNDFATSPAWVLEMQEIKKPSGPPKWLLALIAVIVVLVIAGGVFLFFRGGDGLPNVIGQTVAHAQADLGDFEVVRTGDDTVQDDPAADCVLMQHPPAAEQTDATRVALFTVGCPPRSPNLPNRTVDLTTLCATTNDFCAQLLADVGAGYATDAALIAELNAQSAAFVAEFRPPGDKVPQVVGLSVAKATAAIAASGLGLVVADGTEGLAAGDGCVLFQQPAGGRLQFVGDDVTVVRVACPALAPNDAAVRISTTINLVDYRNVCEVAEALCDAVREQPDLGADHFATALWVETLDTQESLFGSQFTFPSVPELLGKGPSDVSTLLGALGLKFTPAPGFFNCPVVSSQSPAAEAPVEDAGGFVSLGWQKGGRFSCLFLAESQVFIDDFVFTTNK